MPNRMLRDCTDSDKVNLLSPNAEVLFYRLMMKADDFGCFYGNVRLIKANCFPLKVDSVRDTDISRWMDELQKAGLIVVYTYDEKNYLRVLNFGQRLRSKKSKFPIDRSQLGLEDLAAEGYVYVLGDGNQPEVKIGYSLNPWSRVKEISAKEKRSLSVLMHFRGEQNFERELHKILAQFRTKGEWFRLNQLIMGCFTNHYNEHRPARELTVAIRSLFVVNSSPPEGEVEDEVETEGEVEAPTPAGPESSVVMFDIEQYLLNNQIVFEECCLAAQKNAELGREVLKKYHLWLQENEKYPKTKLSLISGFKRWLINEKNGTHKQPTPANNRQQGANQLLDSLRKDLESSAGGGRNL